MKVKPLPKRWLIHSIVYKEIDGVDDWDTEKFKEPIVISKVRVDLTRQFARNNQSLELIAEAVIFIDAHHSSPFLIPKERSKIIFNGREYTVKRVAELYYPEQDKIRHLEIEVI